MSPSLTPQPPGTRYKIIIAKLNPDGTTADWIDFDGDTYVVAVAHPTATSINADLDFAGETSTCLQLLGHLADFIHPPSER